MQPHITIKYGKLIDPFFKTHVAHHYPDYTFPSPEDVEKKVVLFKEAWSTIEQQAISALYSATNLEFKRNQIDCFIVTATPRHTSSPLIIRSRLDQDEFVDALIHELTHILFSDNKTPYPKICENEEPSVANHVMVFAVLTHWLLDILKDEERLAKNRSLSLTENNTSYRRAWEIIDHVGYQEVIEQIKKSR